MRAPFLSLMLEQLGAIAREPDDVAFAIAMDDAEPTPLRSADLERPSRGTVVLRFRSALSPAADTAHRGRAGGGGATDREIELEAKDGQRLRFRGRLLGEATSRDEPGLERWTEVRIYKSDRGNYITERVGRTTVDGEVDRSDALASTDPRAIVGFLAKRGFLTLVAREAIERAAALDPAVGDGLITDV